jgi:cell division GTPase FtsZ
MIEVGPLKVYIRPYSYKELTKNSIKSLEQQKIISIVNDETLTEEEKIDQFGESFVKLTELTVNVVAGCIDRIETPDGIVNDQQMILEFINNTSKEMFNAINDRIVELKDDISLKSQTAKCQECEHEYLIDVTLDQSNFFAVGS